MGLWVWGFIGAEGYGWTQDWLSQFESNVARRPRKICVSLNPTLLKGGREARTYKLLHRGNHIIYYIYIYTPLMVP